MIFRGESLEFFRSGRGFSLPFLVQFSLERGEFFLDGVVARAVGFFVDQGGLGIAGDRIASEGRLNGLNSGSFGALGLSCTSSGVSARKSAAEMNVFE